MKALLLAAMLLISFVSLSNDKLTDLTGAWEYKNGDTITVLIFTDKCFTETRYDLKNKTFVSTLGGSWSFGEDVTSNEHTVSQRIEFSSAKPEIVGTTVEVYLITDFKGKLRVKEGSSKQVRTYSLLDNGSPGKLAGAWLITGRMQGKQMQSITPGARRTMKIMSGSRFQWIAYNTDTKEFLGTGGGTYATENGKYTENIEFFSRDNSRVGAKLSFDFSLNDGNWRHKGLSSKGDPIDEVWTKREKIKL